MTSVYERLVKKHGFSPAQKIIINLVDNGKVLEIGSSSGYMTREFVKNGCIVDAVEADLEVAKEAAKVANDLFAGSIEEEKVQQQIKHKYDFVVCADVLEHLTSPEKVLKFLKSKIKKDGFILISIPNIAFWDMRLELLKGKFVYRESGLLDKTHLRFYTYNSFLKVLQKIGFKIVKIFPAEGRIPFEYTLRKIPILGKLILHFIKPYFMSKYPNLTYYHYVIQAKT